jgi:hypothetical protein
MPRWGFVRPSGDAYIPAATSDNAIYKYSFVDWVPILNYWFRYPSERARVGIVRWQGVLED